MKKETTEWEEKEGDNTEQKWSQENHIFLTKFLILLEVVSSMAINSPIEKPSKWQELILVFVFSIQNL